jgi:hypothetical protein
MYYWYIFIAFLFLIVVIVVSSLVNDAHALTNLINKIVASTRLCGEEIVRYWPLPSRDVDSKYWKYAIATATATATRGSSSLPAPLIDIIFHYFDS